jgi:hypothetical protein
MRTKLDEAKRFLRDLLAQGPCWTTNAAKQARDQGISLRTLQRAARLIQVETTYTDQPAGAIWQLPSNDGEWRRSTKSNPDKGLASPNLLRHWRSVATWRSRLGDDNPLSFITLEALRRFATMIVTLGERL